MMLRDGVKYGPAFASAGALGFYGEGYWFHYLISHMGWSVRDLVTPAFKCVTLYSNSGNMPLDRNFQPKERFPRCIIVDPLFGHTLNAVAWSNPGIAAILERGCWQNQEKPFVIQLGSAKQLHAERLQEYTLLAYVLGEYLPSFRAPVAVQLAFGCPNVHLTGEAVTELEISLALDIFSTLDRPLIANLSPVAPVSWIAAAANHTACDAIWLTNTIPWGHPGINWQAIYGSGQSPLEKRGFPPGGYSGPAACLLHLEGLLRARKMMLEGTREVPIVSGGAYDTHQAYKLLMAGASGIAIGGTMRCRPWWTPRIARLVNRYSTA